MIAGRLLTAWWIVTVLAASCCLAADPYEEQWEYLQEPPEDTAEVQNRRIWLAQEQSDTCLMEVSIQDSAGTVVRHFLNRKLGPHYYNVYWDRKDDSGRWVPAGAYKYATNDCGGNRSGKLWVNYRPYETSSFLHIERLADSGLIEFDIPKDSLRVSLGFYDRAGTLLLGPIKDSIMTAGRHQYRISKIRQYVGGVKTLVKLRVEDAAIIERFEVAP
jgi:hypothetical protein